MKRKRVGGATTAPTARTAPKETSAHRKISRQNGKLVVSSSNSAPQAQPTITPTPVRRSVFERLTPAQPQQLNNDEDEIVFSQDCFARPLNSYRRKRSRNARRNFNNHAHYKQNNARFSNNGLPLNNFFTPLTWDSQMKFTPGASSSKQQNRGKKIAPPRKFQKHRKVNPAAQIPYSSTSYQRKYMITYHIIYFCDKDPVMRCRDCWRRARYDSASQFL